MRPAMSPAPARPFALTPGEPAGIGPDLCLLLARESQPQPLLAIANAEMLRDRARQLGLSIEVIEVTPQAWPTTPAPANSLYCWDTPLGAGVQAGQLNAANAGYVLETLRRA